MWVDFKRIVRSGFIGFWRNAYVSFAAIFVMTITLFVIGSAIFLGQLLDSSLASIRDKVDINVYLVTNAAEQDISSLKTSLEALTDVEEVTYTSRQEALEQFRERHESDELTLQALDELGENPLGASLSIRAKDPSQYESIATFLETQREKESPDAPVIDRINFFQNKTAIDKLTAIIGAVEQTGYVASIILILVTVLITLNTIRLAIFTTREEISVMRLVGAGNMFIRGPFIFQGVMYGFIAGILTLLILYPITLWLGPSTDAFFGLSVFDYYVTEFGSIFLVIIGSGVVLGAISSIFAIARYLKV